MWECDPAGVLPAVARPALGAFTHEAAAVEPGGRQVYLTEDERDGGFYRFTPTSYPDLSDGLLEVAVVAARRQRDLAARSRTPRPRQRRRPRGSRSPAMTPFAAARASGTTAASSTSRPRATSGSGPTTRAPALLEVVFDHALAPDASLDAVDNVTVSAAGEIFVCEDGGNMEIGLITPEREVAPFLRFTGPAHPVEGEFKSEVCGVVFDPSGTRMYCTSQRAHPQSASVPGPGAVYEISGPFTQPATPRPSPFGAPAGERRGGPLRRRRSRAHA